jgi:Transposase zinc-ribbon domain
MVEVGGWAPVGGRDLPRSRHEFGQLFPDERACLRYLAKLRWLDGVVCPASGHNRYWLRGDGLFLCAACRHKTSAPAGTIFDKTRTALISWFAAAWYLTNQTQGASR